MTRRPAAPGGDAGSATVLVLGVAMVVVSAVCAMLMLGSAICARHSAQAAADLAALAAAQRIGVDGSSCAAAEAVAAANAVALDACDVRISADGRSGAVDVSVSRPVGTGALAHWAAEARSTAERLA